MMGILLKFYPFQADFPDDLSEDPLDNVELLQDHLEFFPYLCRYQVCNFDLYHLVLAVHIGPPGYRYVDRPLPGGSAKNRPSAVDFGCRRPIEVEIDCWRLIEREIDRRRSIEEEKGKKKRKRKKKKRRRKNTSPARRPRPPTVAARGSPAAAAAFSPARGDGVSPRVGRKIEATSTVDRYTDRPLPGGIAKIDRQRSISVVGGRLREKSKRRRRGCIPPFPALSSTAYRRCPHVVLARGSSVRRPRSRAILLPRVSPHREKDRGDVADGKTCTVQYRLITERQLIGTRTGRYRAVPLRSAVDGRFPSSMSISAVCGRFKEKSTVGGRLRKKKERRRREVPRTALAATLPGGHPQAVVARAALAPAVRIPVHTAHTRRYRAVWKTLGMANLASDKENFQFLEEYRCLRSRTTFYYTLGYLIFMEDSPVKFKASMEPLLQVSV
ncbi:hypothetical protein GW17_00013777 [Ensete ventricosum]|nr:hypothetical protein GW17_00013777 [Ensete ventricosum]